MTLADLALVVLAIMLCVGTLLLIREYSEVLRALFPKSTRAQGVSSHEEIETSEENMYGESWARMAPPLQVSASRYSHGMLGGRFQSLVQGMFEGLDERRLQEESTEIRENMAWLRQELTCQSVARGKGTM